MSNSLKNGISETLRHEINKSTELVKRGLSPIEAIHAEYIEFTRTLPRKYSESEAWDDLVVKIAYYKPILNEAGRLATILHETTQRTYESLRGEASLDGSVEYYKASNIKITDVLRDKYADMQPEIASLHDQAAKAKAMMWFFVNEVKSITATEESFKRWAIRASGG